MTNYGLVSLSLVMRTPQERVEKHLFTYRYNKPDNTANSMLLQDFNDYRRKGLVQQSEALQQNDLKNE